MAVRQTWTTISLIKFLYWTSDQKALKLNNVGCIYVSINDIYPKMIRNFFMYKNHHIEPFCYILKRALFFQVLITELSMLVEEQIKTNTFYQF